jgi:hypothetical protein
MHSTRAFSFKSFHQCELRHHSTQLPVSPGSWYYILYLALAYQVTGTVQWQLSRAAISHFPSSSFHAGHSTEATETEKTKTNFLQWIGAEREAYKAEY